MRRGSRRDTLDMIEGISGHAHVILLNVFTSWHFGVRIPNFVKFGYLDKVLLGYG